MDFSAIDIQPIQTEWLIDKQIFLDVLRLDKIDPLVSGNKWFKLKYYLQDAITLQQNTVATFGGAWSNHIIATAFAAKQQGLKSIGIIRGEKPSSLSFTLEKALEAGMELRFISRQQFQHKEQIMDEMGRDKYYWIDEGGYGLPGAKGAAEILKTCPTKDYTHVIAAVGTGTMLAGLIMGSNKGKEIIGVSSMKGNTSLEQRINDLVGTLPSGISFSIHHEYHFGGYGKHPSSLIDYINKVYDKHALPLDIIYTGKTFYAIEDLARKGAFKPGSKLLMIHSGGLQGNKSLGVKVLGF